MNRFSIAVPFRTSYYNDYAVVLHRHGLLRHYILGTRRGCEGVPGEATLLYPAVGLVGALAGKFLSTYTGESVRFATYPWFDWWASKKLTPPDHIISSYGYANACFKKTRQAGGKAFVEAGNSHPQQFWDIMVEEHRRWGCELPPVYPPYYRRSLQSVEEADFVLSPSRYVSNSFLKRGFRPEQIIYNPFACDLSRFKPSPEPRPRNRPLTLIHTGMLGLRKGTPYLLEAFRELRKHHPSARLILIQQVHNSVKPVLARYGDLPIEWTPTQNHEGLAALLRQADLFVMPTLEEGFARTLSEALACGVPVITTEHSGVNDYIIPGTNGEVVPLRDSGAIVSAVLKWADRLMASDAPPVSLIDSREISFESFERRFLDGIRQLESSGLL